MKKLFLLLLMAIGVMSTFAANFTGIILPEPQNVEFLNRQIPLSGKFQITWDNNISNAADMTEVAQYVKEIAANGVPESTNGADINILLKHIDGVPSTGYKLNIYNKDGMEYAEISASDIRGFYYGAATLHQLMIMTDGKIYLNTANVFDYPVWKSRYVSDVIESATLNNFSYMAANKLSGIGLRAEGNWQSKEWMQKIAPRLADMKKAANLDLADVMVQMHMLPKRSGRPINLTREEDIQMVVNAASIFAENGAKLLMIAVDDLTPREGNNFTFHTEEEKKMFGDSAGKGHGYLMRRLYDALHQKFPDLQLSMVIAPYATENHGISLPEVEKYFVDWGKEAPVEVSLVWTGKNVFSPLVTLEEQEEVTKLLNGQPLFIFSNANGIAPPMPRWETEFHETMVEDSQGIVLLWGSLFNRPIEKIYFFNANDALWNPEAYNVSRSYLNSAATLYGNNAAAPLTLLQQTFQDMLIAKSIGNRAKFAPYLAAYKNAYKNTLDFKTFDGKPLPLAQMKNELDLAEQFMNHDVKVVEPGKNSAKIMLANRGKSAIDMPVSVDISYNNEGISFLFDITNPKLPDQKKMPHDSFVYLNPDNVEIYIQPGPDGQEWINSEPPNNGYAHFCFDSAGNKLDAIGVGSGYRYEPEWEVTTSPTATGWSANVFIPYTAFETLNFVKPAAGVVWRGNIHRVNNDAGLVQSWETNGERFHMPEFFGDIRFSADIETATE